MNCIEVHTGVSLTHSFFHSMSIYWAPLMSQDQGRAMSNFRHRPFSHGGYRVLLCSDILAKSPAAFLCQTLLLLIIIIIVLMIIIKFIVT